MTIKSRVALVLGAFVLISAAMEMGGGIIDLAMLFTYDEPDLPPRAEYRFNEDNPVTDLGATLGRVLFYDKQLSVNGTTACASCHQQSHAFGDDRKVSIGFNGEKTARHAMRLVNVDNHAESAKFWDERAFKLEDMTTAPIKDPIEMGFSGTNGFPDLDSLIRRMETLTYYPTIFKETFGDDKITEERMSFALAQFVRSIMTFDSRFDEGFRTVGNEIDHFPNFTDEENRGKRLFFNFPGSDPSFERFGVGCGLCHKAPGFDIIHLSRNNGVIGVAGDSTQIDLTVERSPSLKNLVKPDGRPNGPFMHDGSLETLEDIIEHYNHIPANPANDLGSSLLFPGPDGSVNRNMTDENKADLLAFLKTLTGREIFSAEKWSDPFDAFGNLEVINTGLCTDVTDSIAISICDGAAWKGRTEAGIYEEIFDLGNSCDSTLVTTLTVLEVPVKEISIALCEGDSYLGYDRPGTYELTLTAASGCDTVLTLNLEALPSVQIDTMVTICFGETYKGQTQSGSYQFVTEDLNGFDSLTNLNLEVLPSVQFDTLVTICPDESYLGENETGSYEFISLGINGCDSLTIVDLVVLDESAPECQPSAVAETKSTRFSVTPNPTTAVLFLHTNEISCRVVLRGSSGVELREFQLNNSERKEMDLIGLASGIYFLSLYDVQGQLIHFERVIKI